MNITIDWASGLLFAATLFCWTMYVYSTGHKEGMRVGYFRGRSINFKSLADKE
jgi:hypothetical protein